MMSKKSGRAYEAAAGVEGAKPHDDIKSDSSECKFLLDAAATPSYIRYQPTERRTIANPISIQTANGTALATEKSKIMITPSNGERIRVPCIVNMKGTENLLSMADAIRQIGPIICTTDGAYRMPTQNAKEHAQPANKIAEVINDCLLYTSDLPTICSV